MPRRRPPLAQEKAIAEAKALAEQQENDLPGVPAKTQRSRNHLMKKHAAGTSGGVFCKREKKVWKIFSVVALATVQYSNILLYSYHPKRDYMKNDKNFH